ncbi:MAG: CRISPR-associated helicase Cas3' [Synergistaceae bacterium]|jgi:CRISPR-associated endonuclease/helicase Cas3|nr:CRISPR-associated helicase Cas3' [Synergistaceae bacterium]
MLLEAWTNLLHGSLNGDLKSHKEKKLSDHLLKSDLFAQDLLRFHGLTELEDPVLMAACTHDLGKAHPDFQKRLEGSGKKVEHSAPSALFTLSIEENLDLFRLFLSAEAVRRHHSHISNWEEIFAYWCDWQGRLDKIHDDMSSLLPKWPNKIERDRWKKLGDILYNIDTEDREMHKSWFELRTILSLLVASDRMDAINVEHIQFDDLPEYKKQPFQQRNEMDAWRTKVTDNCLQNARKICSPGIFTLTLPTGSGKTNIGLSVAHIIAEKLGYKTIIYALPFISIVEQNADFAKHVFGDGAVQEDHSLMLAKDEDEDIQNGNENWRRMSRLFRYWNSPIVVTTMAQLWDTIFSPKASATMDFHRLSRAVVIMDEPQGISPHLWCGFGEALKYIHEKWRTVFILMTATQPEIANGVDRMELAPAATKFPFKRHRYKFLPGKYTVSDLPRLLREHELLSGKPGLVVMNTKRSALEAFKLLREELKEAKVYMLSRWMSPQHRRETLRCIKQHQEAGELHYLVSTQVVEAGVDLDFDWVFRDFGPLDSIIQVAGRCNRSLLRDEGLVLVAEFFNKSESGAKAFAGMVYEDVVLCLTAEILNKMPSFGDDDVQNIVADYYKKLMSRLNPRKIWENIRTGQWGEYTPLFEENQYDVPVYVDRDKTLDELIEKLRNMDKSLENREVLKKLRNTLQQYAIAVSKKYLTAWSDKIGNFVTNNSEQLEFSGDDYCIIRPTGIGESEEHIYHTIAGFQPRPESSLEDDY